MRAILLNALRAQLCSLSRPMRQSSRSAPGSRFCVTAAAARRFGLSARTRLIRAADRSPSCPRLPGCSLEGALARPRRWTAARSRSSRSNREVFADRGRGQLMCEMRSGNPAGEDRLTLAREIEQVQPLVDVSREDRIARHPVGEFRMIERRFGMNRAENSGMELGLHACFDGIGDHQIGLARRKRVEDRRVFGPRDDRCFLKMSPSKRSLVPPGLTMMRTPG